MDQTPGDNRPPTKLALAQRPREWQHADRDFCAEGVFGVGGAAGPVQAWTKRTSRRRAAGLQVEGHHPEAVGQAAEAPRLLRDCCLATDWGPVVQRSFAR